MFEHLLSSLRIRDTEFRNRIFSTGHMTRMTKNGLPTSQMIAYHQARARGGAGLIITEAARVHDSALSDSPAVDASSDACIQPYSDLAGTVQQHGCRLTGSENKVSVDALLPFNALCGGLRMNEALRPA